MHKRPVGIRDPCKPDVKSERAPSNEDTAVSLPVAGAALGTAVLQFFPCLLQTAVVLVITAIETTWLYSPSLLSF